MGVVFPIMSISFIRAFSCDAIDSVNIFGYIVTQKFSYNFSIIFVGIYSFTPIIYKFLLIESVLILKGISALFKYLFSCVTLFYTSLFKK